MNSVNYVAELKKKKNENNYKNLQNKEAKGHRQKIYKTTILSENEIAL